MTDDQRDDAEFDETVLVALAEAADVGDLRADVKARLMSAVTATGVPAGLSFDLASDREWRPHPVPGIRMKVLTVNRDRGYVTLLLDVAPGARFPAHHHTGAEECYVISGSVFAGGRRIKAGDFHHADANSDHGELWTEEGCRVLLVVSPEDYLPALAR